MNILTDSFKVEKDAIVGDVLPFYRLDCLDIVSEEISIDTFEEYAEYRMKLYLQIDKNEIRVRNDKIRKGKKEIQDDPKVKANAMVKGDNYEKDIISHFIMRAAFSTNSGDREKFIERESRLFEYRYSNLGENSKDAIEASGYRLEVVSGDKMRSLFPKYSLIENGMYYSMDFENVPRQLIKRNVFLRRGQAYIHSNELTNYLQSLFEDELRKGIEEFSQKQHQFQDPRIKDTLKQLTDIYIQEENLPLDSVTPAAIPRLAKQSFPLCMMRMYKRLTEKSHLYYDGREQLGRFLKGIGLSLDGSLEFFQSHFCRNISIDKFSKEYSYNIRYMYGKEGRRVAMNPQPCSILTKVKASGEQCHGCPFTAMRESDLEILLNNFGVHHDRISNILTLYKQGQIERSCREYFLALHLGSKDEGVEIAMHPVLWYKKSRQFYEEKEQKKE